MMTESTPTPIRYDIRECHGSMSGTECRLYLIPAEETEHGEIEIYAWSHIGPGTPGMAYNRRWFYLGSPGTEFVAESLIENLRSQEGTLREINDAYLGAEWDGSNMLGRWSGEQCLDALCESFDAGIDFATYWDAADYLSGYSSDPSDYDFSGGIGAAAVAEVSEARDQGAYLDVDEVEDYLRRIITEHAEELEDEIDELDASENCSEIFNLKQEIATLRKLIND